MDLNFYLKVAAKKLVGSYLLRYAPAKAAFLHLKQNVPSFICERLSVDLANNKVLIASIGWYGAGTEAIYAKTLETLGYEVHILTAYDPFVEKIFKIFGIRNLYYYEDYFKSLSLKRIKAEAENLAKNVTLGDVLKLTINGIQAGKHAASSVMRLTRKSSFDLKDDTIKSLFIEQLASSLRAARAVEMILNEVKPDLVYVNDRGYTPGGQLFDACLKHKIHVIQRCSSHKSGWEMLKRYSRVEMGSVHPHSLSAESLEYVRSIEWNDSMLEELYNELERTYKSGDWFSEVGTQFNKVVYSKKDIESRLQLDSRKKTAIIFPHIFWDATFFWGEDLFKDYHDWFVNVLKVAAKNGNLNWIIKIHPANTVKAKRDNYRGEHVELMAVYETLGQLPKHMKVIPPESDINTFSLFEIMDYCLTVRGTIGIEASAFGINTLTAGTGRYDRLGFTHDFNSKEDYLKCIQSLEDIPPMTKEAIELARRYAYGIFILRSIRLDVIEHGYQKDEKATMKFQPLFKSREEFEKSSFVQELRSFVKSGKEDYLNYPHGNL